LCASVRASGATWLSKPRGGQALLPKLLVVNNGLEAASEATFHPADNQEAVRKLDFSQEQERKILKKFQAPDLGQSLGIIAQESGQTGNSGSSAALPN